MKVALTPELIVMDGPAIGDSVRISGAPPRGQLGNVIEEDVRDGLLHFQVLIFDSKCWLPPRVPNRGLSNLCGRNGGAPMKNPPL